MKKSNSILVLGMLSISSLIILSIIQSSTAQYPRNSLPYDYYNRYYDDNMYSYEQYNYDKSYEDNYDDDNKYRYEQYKKSLEDNYDDDDDDDDDDEYYDSDDYFYDKTFDLTVRLPW
jgi:hypothetical protein